MWRVICNFILWSIDRELPSLAKTYVMRMLFLDQPLPQAAVALWVKKDSQKWVFITLLATLSGGWSILIVVLWHCVTFPPLACKWELYLWSCSLIYIIALKISAPNASWMPGRQFPTRLILNSLFVSVMCMTGEVLLNVKLCFHQRDYSPGPRAFCSSPTCVYTGGTGI